MLTAGTRLGPYEVLSSLGAGGMGEVYKGRDTRLERIVAIKILSASLVGDREFRDRFEREARTISQLTHPHICVLHDIGRYEDTDFLVMEFLDGESLAARIERGPLKIDEVLRIGAQIARALHAAHRAGIVHRDLKPGNVMLTKAGAGSANVPHAKLLDFGLAKHGAVAQGPGGQTNLTAPPTMTSPLTMRGSIVGTLHYMAPEQLDGAEADARSDMFALGAVLYEMTSGRKAFTGKSQVGVMAAILEHDPPPLASVIPSVPPALDRLIRKCLAKDPEARWQSAGDVASELEWIGETLAQGRPLSDTDRSGDAGRLAEVAAFRRRTRVWMAAALLLPLLASAAVWILRRPPAPTTIRPVRFALVSDSRQLLGSNVTDRNVALSPDGTHAAYRDSLGELIVRSFDQLEPVALAGIGRARAPFFSPDGKWIGFFAPGPELRKVPTAGGPPIPICKLTGDPRGASWSDDDTIVFAVASTTSGLLSVPAAGGEPKIVTKPDPTRGESYYRYYHPAALPQHRGILYTVFVGTSGASQIAVFDFATGQSKTLIRGGSQPEYLPTGHIVYAAGTTLRAVRFDLARLEVTSEPISVVDRVPAGVFGSAEFAVSRSGTLLYVAGDANKALAENTLVWVDRDGREQLIPAPPRAYTMPRISPDGTRVALDIRDQENDIWIFDLHRQTLERRTFDPQLDQYPVWTPDGKRLLFASSRLSIPAVFSQAADGTGTAVQMSTPANLTAQFPSSMSPDGTRLILREASATSRFDIAMLTLGKTQTEPLLQTPYGENNGEVSPDGKWIAYQSDESGRDEIYVRPFPDVNGGRWQISTSGGTRPLWERSGKKLFFLDAKNLLHEVAVTTSPTFSANVPVKVLNVPYFVAPGISGRSYDVSPDGKRFLMIKDASALNPQSTAAAPSLVVVLNWAEELKARLP
jgi:serine/threonine-protein kinase